jgi:hypothetical protein
MPIREDTQKFAYMVVFDHKNKRQIPQSSEILGFIDLTLQTIRHFCKNIDRSCAQLVDATRRINM